MKARVEKSPTRPAIIHREPFFSKQQSQAFFSSPRVQPKLTVGQPGDKYEQEADAMADRVIGMGTTGGPKVQAKCAACEGENDVVQRQPLDEEEGLLQTKADHTLLRQGDGSGAVTPTLQKRLQRSIGGGSVLPATTRQQMGDAFGVDFNGVRMHTGTEAIQLSSMLGARAFTYGSDIFFNQGGYNPQSGTDKHLLAHELTHVVQQGEVASSQVQNKGLASMIQRQAMTPGLQLLRVTYPSSAQGHVQHSAYINNTYYVDWHAWIEDDVLLFEFQYHGSDDASVTISLFDTEGNGYIGGGVVRWGPDDLDTQYIEFTEFPRTPSGDVRDEVTTRTELVNETRESSGIRAYKKIYRG